MSELDERELRSSRIPHFAPGVWKENQALRECVLLGYPESHARMLRAMFPALATIYGEEYTRGDPKYCGSYTKGQLRAAVQDLRYTAGFLAMVAQMGIDEESETDQRLGWFADRLAVTARITSLTTYVTSRFRRSVTRSLVMTSWPLTCSSCWSRWRRRTRSAGHRTSPRVRRCPSPSPAR